jgi:hypothetical protein
MYNSFLFSLSHLLHLTAHALIVGVAAGAPPDLNHDSHIFVRSIDGEVG